MEDVNICSGCKKFKATEYGGIEEAVEALGVHAFTECDSRTENQGYHTESHKVTVCQMMSAKPYGCLANEQPNPRVQYWVRV